MSTDAIVLFNICWGAIASTLFVILYPVLSPGWRRTWIGWALFTSSSALALLLVLSVAGRIFGREYLHYDVVVIAITALVALGASLKLTALLVTKVQAAIARRNS